MKVNWKKIMTDLTSRHTQQYIADHLGVSQAAVWRWCKGTGKPHRRHWNKLLDMAEMRFYTIADLLKAVTSGWCAAKVGKNIKEAQTQYIEDRKNDNT